MRIAVCVKYVPALGSLRFDRESRRLVREGVPGEVSSFDLRALGRATALRAEHGGEVVALSMGPPAAREGLVDCLALGADRAVHLCDPLLAGSDTLATARALAAALRREAPDVILCGRASTDAETGQVGPEVAELLDLPQVTAVRTLTIDPVARTFVAERETDEGFQTLGGRLPALFTAAEDLAEERFPTKGARQAAAARPVATVTVAELGLRPEDVGAAGSPTWVAGLEEVAAERRGELVTGETPEALAQALGERLRALGALASGDDARPTLPPIAPAAGDPLWVVVECDAAGIRPVTAELLAKAAALGAALGAPVEAVVIGTGAGHAPALAAAGAARVLVAAGPGLEPYTTGAHAAVLAEAIRRRRPRLVLLGSTARGRDLAPRVAARLGLGLTGDAIDLVLDPEGNVRQHKPAFGGSVVAPIVSRTRPEMATVRPGLLPAARPEPARRAALDVLPVPAVPARVRVLGERRLAEGAGAALDAAEIVIGVGQGIGGPEALPPILALATRLGAGVAATREVTDAGWLPKQHQVGLTGRAIAPRLYVGLALSGAMEHLVGLRRAGTIVAVNKSAKAPILRSADLTVVGDYRALLPHLEAVLRGRAAPGGSRAE
jgi:electron transfer flavoprotein alpha subunit